MAASAADIRSALSLPEPNGSSSTGYSAPKKHVSAATRKPDGISRELYSLIGPSAPSLAAQFAKPRLKQKPHFSGGASKVKWELRPFKNGARQDKLELRHWEKVTTEPTSDYPFAKYNIQSTSYTYSQDEYTRFLEDKEWTKDETDYLFNIVKEYDTRWYIIHDRYEYPGGPSRSMEDMKDRYYSVCRKLVRNRPWAGDEASRSQLMSSFQFDKDREVTRKKYILSLENRTPEQIAEEEALYIEVKRLEQTERKFKKERENLLRTLAGIDSGLPDIVEDDGALAGITSEVSGSVSTNAVTNKKKRKVGQVTDLDSPATPTAATAPATTKRPKTPSFDPHLCIIRVEVPSSGVATKAAHQPAYLRSFKLPTPKAAIAPKVTQALAELGISHNRLVMPTRETTANLEALLDATTALVDTKRAVERVEYEIQVLKDRLALREQNQSGDVDGSQAGADAEGENDDGEDGRAQSVVSVRSARGRKHQRRSVSISSVDTVSTRANMKRQKRS
ncbi:hypothetical protein D9613_005251 [Agrocybe pediades]|uniref:SWR1-complex protein 4 n=1 Tax=Agrocybe pediades TaxID=84607 RepID=A0A8H4VTH9_9AGAR|nr:hypothetical protein D9613_005251 [Agrocybe pediades]